MHATVLSALTLSVVLPYMAAWTVAVVAPRARVALRWFVAGSATLRAIRRPMRRVSTRGAVLALVLVCMALVGGCSTRASGSSVKTVLTSALTAGRASKEVR